jgi:hypothetical protein
MRMYGHGAGLSFLRGSGFRFPGSASEE